MMAYSASIFAIGTTVSLHATDPAALVPAVRAAESYLADLDRTASRFRPDSELSVINRRAASRRTVVVVSPLFAEVLRAAMTTAKLTQGLVDPTVGSALMRTGYDTDIQTVAARKGWVSTSLPEPAPGWKQINFTPELRLLEVPRNLVLDFGASAKAHAADRIAELLAGQLPGGFLVDLGGDLAVAGPAPAAGWQVGIESASGSISQVVSVRSQGLATSSTRLRTWLNDGSRVHHIVDPRTGRTAPATWAEVTCTGISALEANAASTAAVVLGEQAPGWLTARRISARLQGAGGRVILTGHWPAPDEDAKSVSTRARSRRIASIQAAR